MKSISCDSSTILIISHIGKYDKVYISILPVDYAPNASIVAQKVLVEEMVYLLKNKFTRFSI
jgi:hypothetical protein